MSLRGPTAPRFAFLLLALFPGCSGPERTALEERELAARGLAEHLVLEHAGQQVLVIGNPFAKDPDRPRETRAFEAAALRGLRRGFDGRLTLASVDVPAIRSEYRERPETAYVDPRTTTPLSYLIQDDSMEELARKHPDCQVLISLIGLPPGFGPAPFWNSASAPKIALLLPDLRLLGDPPAIARIFRSGRIAAAVLEKPAVPSRAAPAARDEPGGGAGAPPYSGAQSNRASEFARRFFLVTPANVDEMIQRYPQRFGVRPAQE